MSEVSRFYVGRLTKLNARAFYLRYLPLSLSPFTPGDSVNEFLRQEYQLRSRLTTFPERSAWKQSNAARRGLPSALKSIDPQIAARTHLIFAVERHQID